VATIATVVTMLVRAIGVAKMIGIANIIIPTSLIQA
jgi:hypothetical protein